MSRSSQSTPETGGTRLPDIHADILLIVFCGGTIGTALRYAFAQVPAAGANGSWHIGTLVANLLACLCYAGLTAFLAGSLRIPARRKEIVSRGLGMGMCGGLSTMSTLALESFTAIHGGDAMGGCAYLLTTFALGLACAWLGAAAGARLTAGAGANIDAARKEA